MNKIADARFREMFEDKQSTCSCHIKTMFCIKLPSRNYTNRLYNSDLQSILEPYVVMLNGELYV